ncbi:MAG: hypothetical protein AB7Q29_12995 [Vicinamibacterales bacterium]
MAITFRRRIVAAAIAITAGLTAAGSAAAPRFYDDDPIWIERETEDAGALEPAEVGLFVDLVYHLIAVKPPAETVRAGNVNSVDEVPDSSWYTNRLGRLALTPADVARGPDTTDGPAPGAWTISSSKSDGVTPGFTIKDSAGQRWFLKFDPPGYRGMSTGTEVAVTKLMWALGYHVPENRIAYLRREQLVVGRSARFTPPVGHPRTMREGDVDRLLDRAEREPDGSYRVVASKALEGKPVGRIRLTGTRPDDPNDIVPHENRRELRGYGVFAAWLNHVDAKAINSLDTLVTDGGRSFVRHHLIDFGSTLGSGGVWPAQEWAGTQYLVEPSLIGRQMVGFGFVRPRWQPVAFEESPAIGRLPRDSRAFDPREWRPRVPNRAFLHARDDDRFWAASKLAALSMDMIRAAVRSGDFGDPAAEAFLVKTLADRRQVILEAYLPAVNPISDPALDTTGALTFRNAAVDADVARAPRQYEAVWSRFDNATGRTRTIGTTTSTTTRMQAPATLPTEDGSFIHLRLGSDGSGIASWSTPVHAYFQRRRGAWALVGFERTPDVASNAE